MTIGVSTYSFFWQWHETAPEPLTLLQMIEKTASWEVRLLQICDYPLIEALDDDQLQEVRDAAVRRHVDLELGTRGVQPAHLETYLRLAQQLGATLVRSMVRAEEAETAVDLLRRVIPAYEHAGVRLALETYEQVPTVRLLEIVRSVSSPSLGICLDPANCVAALETPRMTIDLVADSVLNLHVKDFAFTRQSGWVGFSLAGVPLGEGLLDLGYLMDRVRPDARGINQVIEHWLVWQGDSATTRATEDEWTLHNLGVLRRLATSTSAVP
ncbi:MAG TPA: TIM barrel protein [Propionibacteriaceae bacterium]